MCVNLIKYFALSLSNLDHQSWPRFNKATACILAHGIYCEKKLHIRRLKQSSKLNKKKKRKSRLTAPSLKSHSRSEIKKMSKLQSRSRESASRRCRAPFFLAYYI